MANESPHQLNFLSINLCKLCKEEDGQSSKMKFIFTKNRLEGWYVCTGCVSLANELRDKFFLSELKASRASDPYPYGCSLDNALCEAGCTFSSDIPLSGGGTTAGFFQLEGLSVKNGMLRIQCFFISEKGPSEKYIRFKDLLKHNPSLCKYQGTLLETLPDVPGPVKEVWKQAWIDAFVQPVAPAVQVALSRLTKSEALGGRRVPV